MDFISLQKKIIWLGLSLSLVPIIFRNSPSYPVVYYSSDGLLVIPSIDRLFSSFLVLIATLITIASLRFAKKSFMLVILPIAYANYFFTIMGFNYIFFGWSNDFISLDFFKWWVGETEFLGLNQQERALPKPVWFIFDIILLALFVINVIFAVKDIRIKSLAVKLRIEKLSQKVLLNSCSSCQRNQPVNAKFCSDCGSKIGQLKDENRRFCNECGASVRKNGKNCLKCGSVFELNSVSQQIVTEKMKSPRFGLVIFGTLAAVVIFTILKSTSSPEPVFEEEKDSQPGRWVTKCQMVAVPNPSYDQSRLASGDNVRYFSVRQCKDFYIK